jgi:hypothetical protein
MPKSAALAVTPITMAIIKGADVTTAEPRQHAVAAIASLRHAVAEEQPADDGAEDRVAVGQLKRRRQVDQPQRIGPEIQDHRRAKRGQPHPEAPVILTVVDILDHAERAKLSQPGGEPEQQAPPAPISNTVCRFTNKLEHVPSLAPRRTGGPAQVQNNS